MFVDSQKQANYTRVIAPGALKRLQFEKVVKEGLQVTLMRVQEHVKLSTTAAVLTLPWLKKDVWIPFTASILIDVDHYIWHTLTQRTLSFRAALRFFTQADPPQTRGAKFLHHPLALAIVLFVALCLRSRVLTLIFAGLLFHVCLDTIHVTQMGYLKRSLSGKAQNICPECGQHCDVLELHTAHVARNLLERYHPKYFVVMCPACHKRAHR